MLSVSERHTMTSAMIDAWSGLGGSAERKVLGWKLTHPTFRSRQGVTFIETKGNASEFVRIYCLRIGSNDLWRSIYSEIANNFDTDMDSQRKVRAYPKTGDINMLSRFLELSLQHWTK